MSWDPASGKGPDPWRGKGGFGKGGFKGTSGKGKAKSNAPYDWGIPGFVEALTEALSPFAGEDPVWDINEMRDQVAQKIAKTSKRYGEDERAKQRGTATYAKLLVEEFVDSAMNALSAAMSDKPWFHKVNFSGPLLCALLHSFQTAKCFTRTLTPMLEKYVEEGIFLWAEEARLLKAMSDAVEDSGVKETYAKKANTHLQKSYGEAFSKAPYGSTSAATPEFSMLQDFVKGWMFEFIGRAWDVLEHGLEHGGGTGTPSKDEQKLFVTVLFQKLTDAGNAALPHELTSMIQTPPPTPWPFVAEATEAIFDDMEKAETNAQEQAAKRRKGMGKGWGLSAANATRRATRGGCG